MTVVGSVSPERPVIQWPVGSTSGTSAGTSGSASEWPRLVASVKPPPSEPDFGSDLPPVQRITRRAAIGPASVVTVKPSGVAATSVTRAGWRISAPARAASAIRASSTVRAESVTGKSLPVSSCLRATPASSKNRIVSVAENRLNTLRMAAGELPA